MTRVSLALILVSSAIALAHPAVDEHRQCVQNLRIVYDAFRQYVADHGTPPGILEDLVPDYLSDPSRLLCPRAATNADNSNGTKNIIDLSGAGSNYPYEISEQPAGAGHTFREFKRLQRERLGEQVPLLRCFWHGSNRVINVGHDGKTYLSCVMWESNFRDRLPVPYASLPLVALEAVANRLPEEPAKGVDLSAVFNALSSDPWIDGSGEPPELKISAEAEAKLGRTDGPFGLIQLDGKGFAVPSYPDSISIPIGDSFPALNFIHGFAFQTEERKNIGTYQIHFSDGSEHASVVLSSGENIMYLDQPATVLTWHNKASKEISKIVARSAGGVAAPFLIAIVPTPSQSSVP